MWTLWDTDSQEEWWDSYNETSDRILVLASDSDESVICVAERPLPSIQGLGIIARAATQACLLSKVQAVKLLHPLVSIY